MLKLRTVWEVVLLLVMVIQVTWSTSSKPGKRIPTRPFAGPYNVVVHKVTNTTSGYKSSGAMWLDLHMTPYVSGKRQYFWGSNYNGIEVNDDLEFHIHMASWSNHEWKQNAFTMKFPKGCSSGIRHGKTMLVLLFGEDGKQCPIKKGIRRIANQTANFEFPEFRIFPYGRWLFTMVVMRNKQIAGLFDADVETVPKH